MQTWRWTEILQMLGVTLIGRRCQALGEIRHCHVDMFLWQLFLDGLQGDFQLINRLRLRLAFMVPFSHGAADVIAQRVQICRAWDHSFFSMNPLAFSRFSMTIEHRDMRVILVETA